MLRFPDSILSKIAGLLTALHAWLKFVIACLAQLAYACQADTGQCNFQRPGLLRLTLIRENSWCNHYQLVFVYCSFCESSQLC